MRQPAQQDVPLPQELLDQDARIDCVRLVVADEQQRAAGGDGPKALLHPPGSVGGEEDGAGGPLDELRHPTAGTPDCQGYGHRPQE